MRVKIEVDKCVTCGMERRNESTFPTVFVISNRSEMTINYMMDLFTIFIVGSETKARPLTCTTFPAQRLITIYDTTNHAIRKLLSSVTVSSGPDD